MRSLTKQNILILSPTPNPPTSPPQVSDTKLPALILRPLEHNLIIQPRLTLKDNIIYTSVATPFLPLPTADLQVVWHVILNAIINMFTTAVLETQSYLKLLPISHSETRSNQKAFRMKTIPGLCIKKSTELAMSPGPWLRPPTGLEARVQPRAVNYL